MATVYTLRRLVNLHSLAQHRMHAIQMIRVYIARGTILFHRTWKHGIYYPRSLLVDLKLP